MPQRRQTDSEPQERTNNKLRHQKRRHLKRLERARINAIKKDFLAKMGMTKAPDASRFSATDDEIARATERYYDLINSQQDTSHIILNDEDYFAKQYFEYKLTGKNSNCCNLATTKYV